MAEKPRLPTEEEIAQLPRWARVAFAARCARRVLPLFELSWPYAPREYCHYLANSLAGAELSAASGETTSAGIAWSHEAAENAPNPTASYSAWAATNARAAAEDEVLDVAYSAMIHSFWASKEIADVSGEIFADFNRIIERARSSAWDDDTPVDPAIFGRLWSKGAPQNWPDFEDYPTSAIEIQLFAPEGTDPKDIGDSMVKLWEAANEYHMARGGGVLTFDEFKQMMPALVPVGPKSEG